MQVLRISDPLMDKSMGLWIITTARQNYWRVAKWYDLDDLVQDGYLAYAKCKARYGHLSSVDVEIREELFRVLKLERQKGEPALGFTRRAVQSAAVARDSLRGSTRAWISAWLSADGAGDKNLPLLITENELRRWFMSLVKTAYVNYIFDLASKRTESFETVEAGLSEDEMRRMQSVPFGEVSEAVRGLRHLPENLMRALESVAVGGRGNESMRRAISEYLY